MRFIIYFTALIFIACENEVNLNVIAGESKAVLNCILQPDTNISLTLHQSLAINDTNKYPVLHGANVALFENGLFVDSLMLQSNSKYQTDYKAKVGATYSVFVKLANGVGLAATDSLPHHPNVSGISMLQNDKGIVSVRFELHDAENIENYYKIELFEVKNDSGLKSIPFRVEELDRQYIFYNTILFRDVNFNGKSQPVIIVCDVPKVKVICIRVSQLSKSLFIYMVYAIQNYVANLSLEYARVPNFSNVSNNIGIFGAMASLDYYMTVAP